MSQNCKGAFSTRDARDANNNTLYQGTPPQNCQQRPFQPPLTQHANPCQQVTAKVLFGSVTAINDLKLQEKAAREARRTH